MRAISRTVMLWKIKIMHLIFHFKQVSNQKIFHEFTCLSENLKTKLENRILVLNH